MPKPHELPYVPANFELEQELLDQLSSRPGNQRCVVGRDEMLLITHEVPGHGGDAVVFWRRDEGIWVDSQGGRGLRRLAELVERFAVEIKSIETGIDTASSAAQIFGLARKTGPLARSCRNLAVAIEQALAQDEDSRELRVLRDRAREVERAAETLNQDARLALDFKQAEYAEGRHVSSLRLHRTLVHLGLVAGLFLPVIALSTLFHLYTVNRTGFWLAAIFGLASGSVLYLAFTGKVKLFRKK